MKIIVYGMLIFNMLFILGCGDDKNTSTNSTTLEINYTNFDGNISKLTPPSLPQN